LEIRISYNPFTNKLYSGGLSHSEDIRRSGSIKDFEKFIRAIYLEGVLYLRLYYPLEDLDTLTISELNDKSFNLLFNYKSKLLKKIKKDLNLKIKDVKFNYDNDLVRGLKIANI